MEVWQVLVWAIATVLLIIGEIASVQLVSIWFAAGALAAFITALLGGPAYLQIILFVVVSILLLILTRPITKKFMKKGIVATNADSIIGMTCVVTEEIDNVKACGRVFVNGIYWSAKSVDDAVTFVVDERCVIKDIQGVKAVVAPLENNN